MCTDTWRLGNPRIFLFFTSSSHFLSDSKHRNTAQLVDYTATLRQRIFEQNLKIYRYLRTSLYIRWDTLFIILWHIKSCFALHRISQKQWKKNLAQGLANPILKFDKHYAPDPFPELYRKRMDLQSEYTLSSTKTLLYSRDLSNKFRDKKSRLLAHQFKRQVASGLIGEENWEPVPVENRFKIFRSIRIGCL